MKCLDLCQELGQMGFCNPHSKPPFLSRLNSGANEKAHGTSNQKFRTILLKVRVCWFFSFFFFSILSLSLEEKYFQQNLCNVSKYLDTPLPDLPYF